MIVHTVKPGDTVFNIARKHGASPQKIIENNGILNPDRLAPGEKLVIFTPTRTYTVRGSDKLCDISKRFLVTESELKRKNPFLNGRETLYPGQILTVKTAEPTHGIGIANGYYYSGATREKLELALPYLSYLTVGCGRIKNGKTEKIMRDSGIAAEVKEYGVMPLMRIYDGESERGEGKIDNMISAAEKEGYGGITLAAYKHIKENRESAKDYITELRKKANANGLKLILEIDGNGDLSHGDIADGYVLFYDKCGEAKIPTFEDGEARIYEKYSDDNRAEKTFIDLSAAAFSDGEAIGKSEAVKKALASGKDIEYDESLMISSFDYNRYKRGMRESVRVAYPTPENIKAKLDIIHELGFMGIAFDIMNIPIEYLLMFDELFKIPDHHPDM